MTITRPQHARPGTNQQDITTEHSAALVWRVSQSILGNDLVDGFPTGLACKGVGAQSGPEVKNGSCDVQIMQSYHCEALFKKGDAPPRLSRLNHITFLCNLKSSTAKIKSTHEHQSTVVLSQKNLWKYTRLRHGNHHSKLPAFSSVCSSVQWRQTTAPSCGKHSAKDFPTKICHPEVPNWIQLLVSDWPAILNPRQSDWECTRHTDCSVLHKPNLATKPSVTSQKGTLYWRTA